MAALTGKERDQSTKVTFECSSHHYTSPYSRERERKGERERHGRACKRLMRERERVLESRVSSLDGLSGQFKNLKTSVKERGLS